MLAIARMPFLLGIIVMGKPEGALWCAVFFLAVSNAAVLIAWFNTYSSNEALIEQRINAVVVEQSLNELEQCRQEIGQLLFERGQALAK